MNWKEQIVQYKNRALFNLLLFLFCEKNSFPMIRLGSGYGGWLVPENLMKFSGPRLLISGGIGFDISFDISMAKSGFDLILVDPDSKCCDFAKREFTNLRNVKILEAALSDDEFDSLLFASSPNNGAEWRSEQVNKEDKGRHFKSITLTKILNENRDLVKQFATYLKVDIEGSESKLYREITRNAEYIAFLAIEIDYLSNLPVKRLLEFVKRLVKTVKSFYLLKGAGFVMVRNEGSNFYWRNRVFLGEDGELKLAGSK